MNARRRPAHQFATVCGACPVEGCQGRILGAESRKPAKQVVLPPAPAPFVPRSKQAAAATAGKGRQGTQQQQPKANSQATGTVSAGAPKAAAAKPRLVVAAGTAITKPVNTSHPAVSTAAAAAVAKQLPAPQEPKCDRLGVLLAPAGLGGRAKGQGGGAEQASNPRTMTFAEEQALLLAAQEKQIKAKKAQKKSSKAPAAAASTPAEEAGSWGAAGAAPAPAAASATEPPDLPETTTVDSTDSLSGVAEREQTDDPWAALVARARSGYGSVLSGGEQSAGSGGQGPSTPQQLPEPASTNSTPLQPSPLQPAAPGSPLLHVASAPAALATAPSMFGSGSGSGGGSGSASTPWGDSSQWVPSLPTPAAACSAAFDAGCQAGLLAALAQLGLLQGVGPAAAAAALPAAAVAAGVGGFAPETTHVQPVLWQDAGVYQELPVLGQEGEEGEGDDLELADMLALLGCGT